MVDITSGSFAFDPAKKQVVLNQAEGNYTSNFKYIRLVFHGFDALTNSISVNGAAINLSKQNVQFIKPLPKFDPLGSNANQQKNLLPVAIINNSNEQITISW